MLQCSHAIAIFVIHIHANFHKLLNNTYAIALYCIDQTASKGVINLMSIFIVSNKKAMEHFTIVVLDKLEKHIGAL
jgi:hypothetical protein